MHASPTCTMTMGDHGGAIGYLIGEENRGMLCMFTMMNQARLGVGLEGVGIADRAYQQALAFAQERRQGRAAGKKGDGFDPIIVHPDVKRMLMQMRALTAAARTICYATAVALDVAARATDAKVRGEAAARGALLTPIAKAFSTDIGNEVTSLGVQIHGGMGFIEETGAAQHYRDARITAIYEGTNGIQSIDLVTRKLAANGGASVWALLDELSGIVKQVEASNDPAFGTTGAKLRDALGSLERTSKWLLERVTSAPNEALAGATPYLRLFGSTLGGCMLAGEALAARDLGEGAGDPAALRHAGAVLCREHHGAGGLAGTHGDGQRRSGERRGRGAAGVATSRPPHSSSPRTRGPITHRGAYGCYHGSLTAYPLARSCGALWLPAIAGDERAPNTRTTISRHDLARALRFVVPQEKREQGMPDARCTRGLVCKVVRKKTHTSIQVQRRHIRHSLRNGFTAYIALTPEYRAFLPPSPRG